MDAIKDVLASISDIFGTVSDTVSPYLKMVSDFFSSTGDAISGMRVLVFLVGFFGLQLTFLWFFFRYLDKKRLTLPSVTFVLFFFMFLGGALLMISQGAPNGTAEAKTVSAQSTAVVTSDVGEETAQIENAEPALPEAEPAQAELPALPEAENTVDTETAESGGETSDANV